MDKNIEELLEMRIKNTLKNSIYAIVSYGILAILGFLVRKIFIISLPIELLGYEGLFGNVFALLALADLGIESVILYRMFPAFAENNEKEISYLISIYKRLYEIVGLVILVMGIILIPFLRFIICGNELDWSYIYIIYFFQLSGTLCTYFLAYKRLMFTVSQQEYVCIKVDTSISMFFSFSKIFVLIAFKSYILYLICNFASNLIGNIIISAKVKKEFKFLDEKVKVSYSDFQKLGFRNDIKNNLAQKICGTIYGGTDNIVISALLGISSVGLLANYTLIQGYVTNFVTKLLKPFQMSIGNYIYSNDSEAGLKMFRMFDLISFFLASTIATCYICIFNPFISVWLGNSFLLPMNFVIVFAINQYIMWNHQFLTFYRYSFGRYELDKIPIAFAAIVNVLLSIALVKPFGITGIMIGTAAGQMGFWIGRVKVVYSEYITESVFKYMLRQIGRFAIVISEIIGCSIVCSKFEINYIGIIQRILVCIMATSLINCFIFLKTSEMKSIKEYLNKVMMVLKKRGEYK